MDDQMCRTYGWTLDECDRVDRSRVQFMWAVRNLWDEAQKYNRTWESNQGKTQQAMQFLPTANAAAEVSGEQ